MFISDPGQNDYRSRIRIRIKELKYLIFVQVDNTDAEGRLILADALCYADQFDPRCGSWQPESGFTNYSSDNFYLIAFHL
jgi:hypothetical protein